MKKSVLFTAFFVLSVARGIAQVAINNDNDPPDNSAMLDVKSTNKGLLPPRIALNAINSADPVTGPAIGLLVYNTAIAGTPPNNVMTGYYRWNGTRWIPFEAPHGDSLHFHVVFLSPLTMSPASWRLLQKRSHTAQLPISRE